MPPPPKRENLLVNLACNVLVPTLILSKLSAPERLGPTWALVVALAFPLGYGIWDFVQRRKANFISIIGFTGVLLTGGLGLMKVGGIWFAVKEAAVPLVIGAGVLLSTKSKRPLVRELLYNEQVIDVPKVDAALDARGTRPDFEALIRRSSWILAAGFLLSAGLNFLLARIFLVSEPGTSEFTAELGRMNLWSWPVIVVPNLGVTMFALWRLLGGITKLTGLALEDIFHAEHAKPKTATASEETP